MVRAVLTYCLCMLSAVTCAQENAAFEVHQVTQQTFGDAYAPAILGDQVVFCGNQKDRVLYTVIGSDQKEPSDVYFFDRLNPSEMRGFSTTMRTEYYDGPVAFDTSGTICILSQNIVTDHKFRAFNRLENRLGLNEYRWIDQSWVFIAPLPFNDTAYNCSHPALSSDGKILYFSSDRVGGFGGYDIWKSEFRDSVWTEPINLGAHVNSANHEVFPAIIEDKLYFSSNREELGGLDIYAFNEFNQAVALLPTPLNSAFDDFGITSTDGLMSGYFSSNRSNYDAIWSFNFLRPIFENCDSLVINDYCYTLAEENALALDEIPSLIYQWDINGVKRNGIEIDYCFPGPGHYQISLDIIDTLIDAVYANQAEYELIIEDEEQPFITSLDTVGVNEPFLLSSDDSNLPAVENPDYYWSISDGSVYDGPNTTHTFREKGVYRVELGIIGTLFGADFEDCVYKTIVCVDSMEMRETKTTLNSPHLKASEIRQTSFSSESHFLDPSDSSDVKYVVELASSKEKLSVEKDIPADIREDFFIRSDYNISDSIYSYYIGEYDKITDAHKVWYEIVQRGHEVFVRSRKAGDIQEIPLDQAIVMRAILFETNKAEIKDEFKTNLNQLLVLLTEIKTLQLIIYAHTDNVGDRGKNKKLSQQRATAIFEYFVNNGIAPERLKAIGYGEEKPIATNETEEGRAENRRVEFELKMIE